MEANSIIGQTQPDLFEPSEPETDSESDTDSAQPRSSQYMFYITHKRKTPVYI